MQTQTSNHSDLSDMSAFDFPVEVGEAFYEHEGERILLPQSKVLKHGDTGAFLGQHSPRYKEVTHANLFDTFNIALEANGLNQQVQIVDKVIDGGRRAMRTIHFPELSREITSGDTVTPRCDIVNSLDGSWAFQAFGGHYRSLCLNTLVFGGERMYHAKRKHTSGLDIDAEVAKVANMTEMFGHNYEQMRVWMNTKITDLQAGTMLAETLAKKVSRSGSLGIEGAKVINQQLLDKLLCQWEKEKVSLGSTLWALYNAVTYWATHVDAEYELDRGNGKIVTLQGSKKGGIQEVKQLDRQAKIGLMLINPAWTGLEKAA